ncbi:MAG TPA: DNA polymerase IV [Microbacteriaceae bacterium]|nr:DNA polymerase IV [Microbacteriaceae bacterium]
MGRTDGTGRVVTTGPVDDAATTILHADMDAFFASVELLERPWLRGRPAVVGRRTGRSVVSSATYEARRCGVHSAMPMAQALRLCPQAVVLEPHMEKYRAVSARVMAIFHGVTPLVEQVSVDEAFLDVAGARRLFGTPSEVARLLRARVRGETGLSCSIGASAVKFVAKLASAKAKPDGMLVVPAGQTREFLRPLPARALGGVGPATTQLLADRGIHTVGDIAATPEATLVRWLGEAGGTRLARLARGVDPRGVVPGRTEKSIGREQTFEHDVTDPKVLRREVLRLALDTASRLRRVGLVGRTVSLKIRFADFTTLTRSRTLPEPTDVGRRIGQEALQIVAAAGAARPVRLIGVRVENLAGPSDGALLWDPDDDWRGVESVTDTIGARFGPEAVTSASLLGTRPRRVGDTSSVSRAAGG